jgi:hypothetical protein
MPVLFQRETVPLIVAASGTEHFPDEELIKNQMTLRDYQIQTRRAIERLNRKYRDHFGENPFVIVNHRRHGMFLALKLSDEIKRRIGVNDSTDLSEYFIRGLLTDNVSGARIGIDDVIRLSVIPRFGGVTSYERFRHILPARLDQWLSALREGRPGLTLADLRAAYGSAR